jgi:sugar fermentation stimulation protein A
LKLANKIITGKFIERLNRFLVAIEIEGNRELAHLPNPGRMHELLFPGVEFFLRKPIKKTERKTDYDVVGMIKDGVHISLDSNAPNKIFKEALSKDKIKDFGEINYFKPEIKVGNSRLDFLLRNPAGENIYIEIKSVNLVEKDTAKFPDAPTLRGVRHLKELLNLYQNGNRAAVVFIVQRNDAKKFSPNDATDPLFGETLRRVVSEGVEIYSYECDVNLPNIELTNKLEITL